MSMCACVCLDLCNETKSAKFGIFNKSQEYHKTSICETFPLDYVPSYHKHMIFIFLVMPNMHSDEQNCLKKRQNHRLSTRTEVNQMISMLKSHLT